MKTAWYVASCAERKALVDAGRDAQHNYRRRFNEALAEAEIQDYSRHCNRHTFASRLVMAGVDLRTIAELMGHSSIQITMH